MTARRVLAHPGWLSVAALVVLASVAVSAVLDAGLRVWSTNAGIRTGHSAVIGAPLPGSGIVTVPAPPARRSPVPVQQVTAAPTPLSISSTSGPAALGNGAATVAVAGSRPALPTPSAPTAPEVPVGPPALLTLVAPLVPPIRVAGVPLGLRALVLGRQAATGSGAPLLRRAWAGRVQLRDVEDEQPAADTTTSATPWAAGWTPYRQVVRTPAPTASASGWTAHTWRAWR